VTKSTQELVTYRTERTAANKKLKTSPDDMVSMDDGWATVDKDKEEDTLFLSLDVEKESKDKITDTRWLGGLETLVHPVT
jgi:hypothetical protein